MRIGTFALIVGLGALIGAVGQGFAQDMGPEVAYDLGFGLGCACLVIAHLFARK